MGLVNRPFYFANQTASLGGSAPPAAVIGVNFTANANNVDGANVVMLTALTFDVQYLVVGIGGINGSNVSSSCLLDVLTDLTGSTNFLPFIDDLVCGFTPTPAAATTGIELWYHFPIFIPSGASVGICARTAHTSNITSGRCVMYTYGNPSRPDAWWYGHKVESLGITAATSRGTNVTPGNSGAWGSWTDIGTPTTASYGAVQFGVNSSDNASLAIGYYWQVGVSGSAMTQLPGSPTHFIATSTGEISARTGMQPIFCDIPEASQMQLRAMASGTGEVYNAAIYGVY
jgi:hypothetical protein